MPEMEINLRLKKFYKHRLMSMDTSIYTVDVFDFRGSQTYIGQENQDVP